MLATVVKGFVSTSDFLRAMTGNPVSDFEDVLLLAINDHGILETLSAEIEGVTDQSQAGKTNKHS